jgi:hypothetical protein
VSSGQNIQRGGGGGRTGGGDLLHGGVVEFVTGGESKGGVTERGAGLATITGTVTGGVACQRRDMQFINNAITFYCEQVHYNAK